jgi:lysophospholipase L1-like esterase
MNLRHWLCFALSGCVPFASSAAALKIACVGDSITEGAGLSSPSVESYPARLQRLLGTNFVVRNYGVSGRTLLKRGDFPYWKEGAYTQSRDWEPDIVIIKLGTNDSKPYNWRYGTNYVSDFEEFIASYAALTSQPRIILCAPAPVYRNGAFDIRPGTVATNITPAVRDLAARLGLSLIDFQVRLAGHPEWFPDTVHPNTRGMAVMAAVVFDHLQGTNAPSTEPQLGIDRLASGRALLRWPADHAGWVLQSVTQLGATGPTWAVADQVAYSDGSRLRLTNSVPMARFYRLWKP